MASSVNDAPSQLSNGVHNFCISGYPIGDNCRPNLSDGMQSSWRLEICNVHDSSLELLGSLEGPNLFEDNNKKDAVEDFQDYMRAICECMASDSASCSVSSEGFSFEEDCLGEISILQTCPNPPKKLKPGRYWYDNVSGFCGKAICTILSLPTPPGSSNLSGEEVNTVSSNNLEQKTLLRLLLVGDQNSGTSTIFKQAKFVYKIPFTEEERRSVKFMIQINLYGYLRILLEGRKRFEEECLIKRITHDQCSSSENTGQINQKTMYSIEPRLEAFSDLLLKEMVSGNLKTIFHECAHFIEKLWKDPAIQTTYDRMSELQLLPLVATHFLERAVEITMTDYQPSEMDILYAEESASSKLLSRPSMEFSFPKFADESREIYYNQYNPLLRYQLIRVPPSILKENSVLLEPCSDVDIVLFCVSLTDYAEFEYKCGIHTNKMIASKKRFETVVTHSKYDERKFLLVLNKYDLFEEKIKQVPLTRCEWFADFNPDYPVIYNEHTWSILSPSLACHAFHYIAVKFKRWFGNLTNKMLYVSPVAGLEPDSVDEVLRYAREIVEGEDKYTLLNQQQQYSSTSDRAYNQYQEYSSTSNEDKYTLLNRQQQYSSTSNKAYNQYHEYSSTSNEDYNQILPR